MNKTEKRYLSDGSVGGKAPLRQQIITVGITILVGGLLGGVFAYAGARTGLAATIAVVYTWLLARPFRNEELGQRVRPTALLIVYIVAAIAIYLLALRFGIAVAAYVSCVILAICLATSGFAWENLKLVEIEIKEDHEIAYAGSSVRIILIARNVGRRPIRMFQLGLERGQEGKHVVVAELHAGHVAEVTLCIEPQPRGVFKIPDIVLQSDFPFGFYQARKVVSVGRPLVVAPAPLFTPVTYSHGASAGQSRSSDADPEFVGVRRYVAGDLIKHMAWRQMAKVSDHALSKMFHTAGNPARIFGLSDVENVVGVECKLSNLCGWLIQCETDGAEYGLKIGTASISPGRGTVHLKRCLTELARFDLVSGMSTK